MNERLIYFLLLSLTVEKTEISKSWDLRCDKWDGISIMEGIL